MDRETGQPRFTLTVPVHSVQLDTEASQPGVLSDGSIMQAVYQRDAFLHIYHVGRDGAVLDMDRLYEDDPERLLQLNLRALDLSIHLDLSPVVPCSTSTYLISWQYRRGRFVHCEYRQLGSSEPLWTSEEFWAANSAEVMIGTTSSEPTSRIVGRAIADGQVLWSRPGDFRSIAALDSNVLLVMATTIVPSKEQHAPIPPDIPALVA